MGTTDIRQHLEAIYAKHGRLTPGVVVDEAASKKHPLHEHFEWDDKIAGGAWRRHQAHELIRSARIKYATADGSESEVRAFHAVRDPEAAANNGGWVYEPADKVAEDPLLREMVLRDMEREWKQLQRRYGHFREFVDLVRRTVEGNAA